MATPRPIPAGQMARLAHVTAAWLREEADAGRLPHLKAGNRYLFDPETVLNALAKRAREPVS